MFDFSFGKASSYLDTVEKNYRKSMWYVYNEVIPSLKQVTTNDKALLKDLEITRDILNAVSNGEKCAYVSFRKNEYDVESFVQFIKEQGYCSEIIEVNDIVKTIKISGW